MTSDPLPYLNRRDVLAGAAGAAVAFALAQPGRAQSATSGPVPGDRVFLTNEDSNTLSVIDPVKDEGHAVSIKKAALKKLRAQSLCVVSRRSM